MTKITAAITGVAGHLPEYILTNEELSKMVDTNDEWIMSRIGIKERHILKEEGKATSDMGAEAMKKLLKKTNNKAEDVDLIICATTTPDMMFPATAVLIADKVGAVNAFAYDLLAACSGFIFALETATRFIESGRYKKVVVVAADKMSSIVDYTDRNTCVLFGDAGTAIMVEPNEEGMGVQDSILRTDGSGGKYLYMKAGGSLNPATHETVDAKQHFIHQEGQSVFKHAVSKMADVSVEIMENNNLTSDDIEWLVPHQANLRIIDAVARRMGLVKEKVMINIEKYGNTTAATIPLCLCDWEKQLKKGDNLILSTFGGGFTWGSIYIKWAYDSK